MLMRCALRYALSLVCTNWEGKSVSLTVLLYLSKPSQGGEAGSRPNDRDAIELIRKPCRIKTPEEFRLLPEDQQGHFIQTLHEQRCSIHQLSRLLGVSKGQVERIIQR